MIEREGSKLYDHFCLDTKTVLTGWRLAKELSSMERRVFVSLGWCLSVFHFELRAQHSQCDGGAGAREESKVVYEAW